MRNCSTAIPLLNHIQCSSIKVPCALISLTRFFISIRFLWFSVTFSTFHIALLHPESRIKHDKKMKQLWKQEQHQRHIEHYNSVYVCVCVCMRSSISFQIQAKSSWENKNSIEILRELQFGYKTGIKKQTSYTHIQLNIQTQNEQRSNIGERHGDRESERVKKVEDITNDQYNTLMRKSRFPSIV